MRLTLADDRAAQLLTRLDHSLDLPSAQAKLEGASAVIGYGDAAKTPWGQATLVAAVACAAKMFRGGVFLAPGVDTHWRLAAPAAPSLRRALQAAGAHPGPAPASAIPLHVGGGAPPTARLTAWTDGWDAVVGPGEAPPGAMAGNEISGVLAAAMLVAEAFRNHVLGDLLAGRRTTRLSAWGPDAPASAALAYLPRELWLLGLGNLGQATLLVLSLLPYPDPGVVRLLLQDGDVAGPENLAVQILTTPAWMGRRKAREAAGWAERRGFQAEICERRFDAATRPGRDEPRLLLAGVDNLETRRLTPAAGFDLVLDAGLGATGPEAFDLRLYGFPGRRTPLEAWPETPAAPASLTPALEKAVRDGLIDVCGALTVAGKSVGVPCTALAAAALQVGQACRAIATGRCADRLDVSLRRPGAAAWGEMPSTLRDLAFVDAALP